MFHVPCFFSCSFLGGAGTAETRGSYRLALAPCLESMGLGSFLLVPSFLVTDPNSFALVLLLSPGKSILLQ